MASRRTSIAAEWVDSALYTLNQLGFKEHQYVLVAHDDKKHFHIHAMVNTRFTLKPTERIHPLIVGSHSMAQCAIWKPSMAGLTRSVQCDGTKHRNRQCACHDPNALALRSAQQQPTGAAAQYEHYHDEESLQT